MNENEGKREWVGMRRNLQQRVRERLRNFVLFHVERETFKVSIGSYTTSSRRLYVSGEICGLRNLILVGV